ncbi:hypothetical protein T459_35672 [Capsicum annuum]|uniref:Uncharacterized protein n=1 Tax=Capsicum annuum TaxID=4072 RepID=A0A2G2VWN5_CAPAN|nr:hypothetical protein T459_35672 [Capsicum annuum]
MDRRSLPWKKKSSDKTASEKPAALIVESASAPSDSTEPKVDQQFTMDRRSLPWKKKSTDKTASEKPAALIVESASAPSDSTEPKVDQGKQEIKKPKYV